MPNKENRSVKKFRGLRQYLSKSLLPADFADDLLNVIISNSGELSKFRYPTALAASVTQPPINAAPNTPIVPLFDYQKGDGTRQLIGIVGTKIVRWDPVTFVATLIDDTPANAIGVWEMQESHNILYMMNGVAGRALKWTGTNLWNWGIAAPTVVPALLFTGVIATLQRAAGIVTAVFTTPVDLSPLNDVVQITGAGDASFNGQFAIATKVDQTHYTWANAGADMGPLAGGVYGAVAQNPSWVIPGAGAVRVAGITTVTVTASSLTTPGLGPDFLASTRQVQVKVSGVGDASFNGVFTLISKQGNVFKFDQGSTAADATSGGGTLASNLSPSLGNGISWAYSYKNSITGDESSRSPISVSLKSEGAGGRPMSFFPTATASPDAQVDTLVWWRTLDGGGDYFLHSEVNIALNGLQLRDSANDTLIDPSNLAQLINNPPPLGRYLSKFGGRIFILNLISDQQLIAYSGYEQILRGRPEACFPPNNLLRLQIGADPIAGGGAIDSGVVAFSISNQMYMFRGIVEDVVISTPTIFTAYLKELPFSIGLWSHYTCKSTPWGLTFLASDLTFNIFDGSNKPNDISGGVYPILQRITRASGNASARLKCRSAYFNLVERDWIALLLTVDTNTTASIILIFDLNADDNFGVFVVDPQLLTPLDDIMVRELPTGERQLTLSSGGVIYRLPVSSSNVGGINPNPTATSAILPAYWQGGYFGGDESQTVEHFRWGRLVTDKTSGTGPQTSGSDSYEVYVRLTDDDKFTFRNPMVITPRIDTSGKFSVNWKARRAQVRIAFPIQDMDASVLELYMESIPLSDR